MISNGCFKNAGELFDLYSTRSQDYVWSGSGSQHLIGLKLELATQIARIDM